MSLKVNKGKSEFLYINVLIQTGMVMNNPSSLITFFAPVFAPRKHLTDLKDNSSK